MNVNQIYSLLNDINHQLWGADAIDVNDLQGLISMGKNIVGDGTQTDKFINKLVDRIGKTIIRTLDLELDFPNLYMNSYDFGCILQKITISPIEAVENSSWNIGDDNFTPTMLDIHKFDCFVTYFTDTDTWSFRATIPDDQMLATAFTNETTMGAFITGVMSAMTDSVTRAVNNMSRTAVNNFIAEKIKADNGVINLLTGYNTLVGAGHTITADEALYNKDFLRYAVNEIRQYIKYLSQESVLYNVGDGNGGKVLRATARDNMHVLALTRWVASVEANLESETFHNDLVSMPLYTEVPYWQANKGSTTVNDFATNSSIKVIPSSEKGKGSPSDVEQSGIICVLADRQAIAVGLNKRKTATFYNAIDSYTNIKEEATMQFINDLSENGIVFVVADSENPLNDLTVKGADSDAEYYDHVVSTYQSNITVSGAKITGTLKYVEGGLAPSGYLSGSGYFLALSLYDNNFSGYDSVKVGLKPSKGSGLVEIINDPDKVVVMKITDIKKQKFKIVSSKSGSPDNTQIFSLADLTLTE